MNESFKTKFIKIITNRMIIFSTVICIMFSMLFIKLFELQIVNGEAYNGKLTVTYEKPIVLPAPRGNIYDKFGRPLAVNESVYSVKIDPSVQVDNLNEVLYNLVKLFEVNGEEYVDNFPISQEKPYTFEFNESETRKERWLEDMTIPLEFEDPISGEKHPTTAEEAFYYLCEMFEIPEDMDDAEARKILNLRSMIYMGRYEVYNPITIAYNVKKETIAAIEEQGEKYKSAFVDIDSVREYPSAGYTSHIVGYLGRMTETEEIEAAEKKGYKPTDLVGKSGLEYSFEDSLRGENGKQIVEVNANGRPIKKYEPIPATPGNNLYTTIDLEFTQACTEIVENVLKEELIAKIQSSSPDEAIPIEKIFTSLVKTNNVPIKPIMMSSEGSYSYTLKSYIIEKLPAAKMETVDDIEDIKEVLIVGIEQGDISSKEVLLTMHELGVISGDEKFVANLINGKLTPRQVIIDKVESEEITPQMLGLDPFSASAVVMEVETGNVLASVSYPTYDNNQFVNNTNEQYLEKVFNDPTDPMINRPFDEKRAPGSTFKMISAVTGLETGAITSTTEIHDDITFKDAGKPYASCWSRSSHGNINVQEALEVSCNYFFSSMIYEMGNSKEGTESVSIEALNKYMVQFGLNDRAGVEITEARDRLPEDILTISSPEYKEYSVKQLNPEAPPEDYEWVDGDTVRTSFGQASNSYTSAVMCKYISTLASDGVRLKMNLLSSEKTYENEIVKEYAPVVETVVDMQPETIQTVHEGMLLVTEGNKGTAKNMFKDFPIKVAGKTGTAQEQENRPDHSSFGGFAPYDNPQIAVYVMVPYGSTKLVADPATKIAKEIMAEYFGLNHEVEKAPVENSLSI